MVLFLVVPLKAQYNYNDALLKGINFFDANKCGNDVALNNVFSWRGACHISDGSVAGLDLTGGFHDAGDHVKFGLPQCWSAATMGFALYEFKESFDNAGATTKLLSTLKYFTDYFLKCHPNANTFYYQVGDGNVDHGYWGSPELQTGSRPVIVNTTSAPASDVLGEASAALALMYINYKAIDATYANRCLTAAKELFTLGKTNLGRSSDGGGGSFYKSTSHFDDLSWGAIWLSIATADNSYLTPVDGWINQKNDGGDDPYNKHWAPAWDDVTEFVLLKMFELTGTQKYYDGIVNNMVWYSTSLRKTTYGLPWLDTWGVLRYASAEAGLGYLAAKKFQYADYLKTADLSMNYICGSNPRNSSYLTGWGTNPPLHPHHRANEPVQGGPTHGIVGGLVGGPDTNDSYSDVVGNFQQTEVAIDYNAAFLLGMAGKVYFTLHTPPKPNVPPTVSLTAPSAAGSYSQGTAITLSANASDGDGSVTNVEFYVSGSKVGEDAIAPYSMSWTPQLSGSYSITAKAIDDRKGSTTSTAVSINVTNNLPPPTTPNLALNKTATSSSDENGGLPASAAVDGSYGSRWASAFSEPQWLQVDLGSAQTINRVILYWEAAYATAYDIQISTNGTTWITVASIVGGNGSSDDITFTNISARYVRMNGITRVTPYGFSIYEFEVYGLTGTNVPVTGITVSPTTTTLGIGATTQVTPTLVPANATIQTVTWTSSNTAIATISTTGVVTGVTIGTATITGTTVDGGFKATCAVTVTTIPVVSITVSPTTSTISVNGTTQLVGIIVPSTATNKKVTWTTSNAAVATVNATGLVTGVSIGNATITVTTQDGAKTATCAVIVANTPVVSVSVAPTTATIAPAGTAQLTANVAPANATNKAVTWTTSNAIIATVSATGVVTGVTSGSAIITVKTTDGGFTAICTVTVTGGPNSCAFGAPLTTALPTLSKSYNYVYVLGTGPSFANVNNFTINWDLPNKGFYQFSMNTKDGKPNWYVDLRTYATQTFGSVQPAITLTGTGFPGLDGSYYAAIDNGNFVLAEKSGAYTIYFSTSATAPVCTKSAKEEVSNMAVGQLAIFPNPFTKHFTLQVNNVEDVKSIKVVNQLGSLVKVLDVGQFKNNQIEFGDELPAGIYFIQVSDKESTKTIKVIKR